MSSFLQPDFFSRSGPTVWPFGSLAPHAYGLIMIDPPWHYELYSDKGEGKAPQAHYDTMSIEDIAALPVADLAAPDCLLWLWGTAPMLPLQLDVMKAWGFAYVTKGVWLKRTVNGKVGFGTGYALRNAHEEIILGRIGNPSLTRSIRSVVEGPIREHSRKPDQAYQAAEKLVPRVRRADVFSRETRPGWDSCGNEAGKFDGSYRRVKKIKPERDDLFQKSRAASQSDVKLEASP
jgi:N6-adenosine-specific RNA methylase IME4